MRLPLKLKNRRSARWILGTIGALVLIRALLPIVLLRYANYQLNHKPGIAGHIDDLDLHLWRGAYEIEKIGVLNTTGKDPVPLFRANKLDVSIHWGELLHGAIVGEIRFVDPVVNIFAQPSRGEEREQVPVDWRAELEQLLPIRINKLEIVDGEVRIVDPYQKPKVDVTIADIFATATNLTNSREISDTLYARIEARGRPLGNAQMKVDMRVDPYAEKPTFDLDASVEHVDLTKLNDVLKAYASFDVERGTMSVYTEVAAR